MTQQDETAPPLPLPSRRLGKSDTNFPGPQRPQKKIGDDYLTPISSSDIPTLLPPPQKKDPSKMTRAPRRQDYESTQMKNTSPNFLQDTFSHKKPDPAISEMTLTHLLSLGIKDMATKLNVPESKLSTMTLIELTSYLSNFIENSKQYDQTPAKSFSAPSPPIVATFKVDFDQPIPLSTQDDSFFAKFDNNFGEDASFDADFNQMNNVNNAPVQPSADRYAAFREIIIEPEVSSDQNQPSLSPQMDSQDEFFSIKSTGVPEKQDESLSISLDFEKAVEAQINRLSPNLQVGAFEQVAPPIVKKIDTKITEHIANAKDRYAALRDIILVEDLFDTQAIPPTSSSNSEEKEDLFESFDDIKIVTPTQQHESTSQAGDTDHTSPEIKISSVIGIEDEPQGFQGTNNGSQEILSEFNTNNISTTTSNRDDIEIDEYMNRAISNISINSRGNLSPAALVTGSCSKSPTKMSQSANASTSPMRLQNNTSSNRSPSIVNQLAPSVSSLSVQVNDMSTSPIPTQKSPETVAVTLDKTSQKHVKEGSFSDVSPEVMKKKEGKFLSLRSF